MFKCRHKDLRNSEKNKIELAKSEAIQKGLNGVPGKPVNFEVSNVFIVQVEV